MAEPHLPLRRRRLLVSRGQPGGFGLGHQTGVAPEVSSIHGGRVLSPRRLATVDIQLRRYAVRRGPAPMQTGGDLEFHFV